MLKIPTFLALLLLGLSPGLHALIIDGHSTTANDRFTNSPDFIANAFNLSGVAIAENGSWATLISPNVFITANHYQPSIGQSFTFYKTNDPSGPSITRTVASKYRIGSSDLLLCTLNLPVPEDYQFYSFATEALPTRRNDPPYPYLEEEVYHFGKNLSSPLPTPLRLTVGKNVLDKTELSISVTDNQGVVATGPAISCEKNLSPDNIPYETMAQTGDSGGPLFWDEGNNNLRLIGIAWFVTEPPSTLLTGFSAVGDHASDITAFLTLNSRPYQPLAPSAFTGSRISTSQINLSWQDNSAVETSYVLEREDRETGQWSVIATLTPDLQSYSDTSAPEGDVYYRLHAENSTTNTTTASDPVLCSVLTPYSTWAATFDWGTADSSPTADANNDGLANLVAYGFDLSPIDPVPVEALPYLETSSSSIDYFFRQNDEASDLTYTLKRCLNLQAADWQDIVIDGTTVTRTDMDSVDNASLIRIRMPIESIDASGFFRLEIFLQSNL